MGRKGGSRNILRNPQPVTYPTDRAGFNGQSLIKETAQALLYHLPYYKVILQSLTRLSSRPAPVLRKSFLNPIFSRVHVVQEGCVGLGMPVALTNAI